MSKNKHHYVPKFYLRLFASDKAQSLAPRQINIYNLSRMSIIENASIRDQCYQHKFYGETDTLENSIAAFEGEGSKLILKIIDGAKLPHKNSPEYFFLLAFIALQHLRTKQQINEQDAWVDSAMKAALEEDIDHFSKEDWENRFGKDFEPLTRDELKKYKITLNNSIYLSLSLGPSLIQAIEDLEPVLVFSNSHQHFVLSDNPVIRYNQYFQDYPEMSNIGFMSSGLQIILPLSPHCLLVLYDSKVYSVQDKKGKIFGITNQDVQMINLLQYLNADQNIYFSDINKSDQIINLGYHAKKLIKDKKVETLKFDSVRYGKINKDSVLHYTYFKFPNIKLSLSFMKIKRSAKKITLRQRLLNQYRKELPDDLSDFDPPPRFPKRFVRRNENER